MYVILVRETIIEGKINLGKIVKKVGGAVSGAANSVEDAAREAADRAREAAERAAAEALRVLEAAIRSALAGLLRAVTSLDSSFSLVQHKVTEITNISANLEKNVNEKVDVANASAANASASNASASIADVAAIQSQINNLLQQKANLTQQAQMLSKAPTGISTMVKINNLKAQMAQVDAQLSALQQAKEAASRPAPAPAIAPAPVIAPSIGFGKNSFGANAAIANAAANAEKQSHINNLLQQKAKLDQIAQMLKSAPRNSSTMNKAVDLQRQMAQVDAQLSALQHS